MTVSEIANTRFADRADALAMILGSLAPLRPAPGLQTLTMALAVAALLSPKQLVAQRSVLACLFGAARAIAEGYGAMPANVLPRAPLVATIHTVDVTF